MATPTVAISATLGDFAAELLSQNEVIPRSRIIVEQIAKLIPETAVILYLLEDSHGLAVWSHKAIKGTVALPSSFTPRDAGTLGQAWKRQAPVVFAGDGTAREQYQHLDVRRTVVSLGYFPILRGKTF